MKNNILKVLLLLLGTQLYAQGPNLIKNPGFEVGTVPPTIQLFSYLYTFRDNVTYWEHGCSQTPAAGNTPDILIQGAVDCPASAPSNNWTTGLNAHLGSKYVYCGYSSTLGFGESIKGELTQTLTAGTYNVSFYGSKAKGKNYCGWEDSIPETYPAGTVGSVIEVVLRNSANACAAEPVVWTSPVITSLDSWQQLSGSFVIDCDKAAKNYNRIEFRIKTPSSSKGFFIDDVSLSKVNITPNIWGPDDFCLGTPLSFVGSLSPGVSCLAHFWEIQECNSTGGTLIGSPLYGTWIGGNPGGFTFPSSVTVECGKYYRVKLASSNNVSCEWVERTQVIKINCDPANGCPDPCFTINNISSTQNESSLYGPMPVKRLCSPTININGSCSNNETGYHLRIAPFNLVTWTAGPDFYSGWVTTTGTVPSYINLNGLIGGNTFVSGQVYIVSLTVGLGWYSDDPQFFRIITCPIKQEEPESLSASYSDFMNISPNPTNGNVLVSLDKIGSGAIEIYSLDGKLVYNKTFNESRELTVDLSNFSTGIYTAKVTVDGQTTVKKIMKE